MITLFRRLGVRSLLAILLAVGVLNAGCQSSSGVPDSQLTPAQRQLRAETSRFNQTIGEGAIAGAVIGGLIGALAADDNPLAGAAIGAGAGAAVGAGAGYFVASQNTRYASEEARLNAEIQAARQEVASYQRLVDASQRVVNEHKRQIAQLNGQYRQGRITADQYRARTAQVRTDIEQIEAAIDHNREQTQAIGQRVNELRRQGRNPGELAALETRLRGQRQALQNQLNDLTDAMSAGPIESS
jgi:hypothetical protein